MITFSSLLKIFLFLAMALVPLFLVWNKNLFFSQKESLDPIEIENQEYVNHINRLGFALIAVIIATIILLIVL